jgi:hypothetical protein
MGANVHLAWFIHQILLAKFLVVQVNWVICSVNTIAISYSNWTTEIIREVEKHKPRQKGLNKM